jgi:hypothetical protein
MTNREVCCHPEERRDDGSAKGVPSVSEAYDELHQPEFSQLQSGCTAKEVLELVIPSEREGSLEPSTERSLLAPLVEMTSFVAALAQDGRRPDSSRALGVTTGNVVARVAKK